MERNTNTTILLLSSTRFERKKNGNYFINKGRESSNPRGGDESRCGWCTRWKAVWMNDEQHQRERRGGGEESHVLLLLASARSVSRQWRATVASFFLLFLAKERGRIDEAARALIAETGRLDASSPRSGTTTVPR